MCPNHFLSSSRQIYPDGIRHIRADHRINEWKTPGKRNIVRCAVNERQVRMVGQGTLNLWGGEGRVGWSGAGGIRLPCDRMFARMEC